MKTKNIYYENTLISIDDSFISIDRIYGQISPDEFSSEEQTGILKTCINFSNKTLVNFLHVYIQTRYCFSMNSANKAAVWNIHFKQIQKQLMSWKMEKKDLQWKRLKIFLIFLKSSMQSKYKCSPLSSNAIIWKIAALSEYFYKRFKRIKI